MAEQQQTNPEAVEALARLADPEAFGMLGTLNNRVMARSHASSILANHGPLLEVLAQAGVLEVEWASRNKSGGGAIYRTRAEAEQDRDEWNADLQPYIDAPPKSPIVAIERRYVSRWEPTDA